jgi:hypothetical protein
MGLIFWGRYGEEKICHSYRISKIDVSVIHPVVSSLCEVNVGYSQRDIIVFLRFVHRFPKTKFYMLFFYTQTFVVATTIQLYDMHKEHFAFGTSCIWFWCAALNQFANNSVLSIRTCTAMSYKNQYHFFFFFLRTNAARVLLIRQVSRSHKTTHHSR